MLSRMSDAPELHIVRDGQVVHRQVIGEALLRLGRATTSDLVLADDRVSGHHLALWVEAGRLWARDLDSRNGTTLNGAPLSGAQVLAHADTLILGGETTVRVHMPDHVTGVELPPLLLVEDVRAGVRVPFRGERLTLGSASDCDLVLPNGPPRAATLLRTDNGVTIGTTIGEFPVALEQEFDVAGHRLKVTAGRPGHVPTADGNQPLGYVYSLRVGRQGVNGPFARLTAGGGLSYNVDDDNRAVLLYLLGDKSACDTAAGLPPEERGWCSDADLTVGIWGRGARDPNSLHVLVYRVRKQLGKLGFDPWFIEKRRHALRVSLDHITVE